MYAYACVCNASSGLLDSPLRYVIVVLSVVALLNKLIGRDCVMGEYQGLIKPISMGWSICMRELYSSGKFGARKRRVKMVYVPRDVDVLGVEGIGLNVCLWWFVCSLSFVFF